MIPSIIRRQLSALRQRERLLRFVWGLARLLTVIVGLVMLFCLVDFIVDRFVETPKLVHVLLLTTLLAGSTAAGVFFFWSLGKPLDDEELSLWIEARTPRMQHRLISAVQFNETGAKTTGMSKELVGVVTREAEEEVRKVPAANVADHNRLTHSAAALGPALLLAAIPLIFCPDLCGDLLARLFLADVEIPRRVHTITSATSPVHPRGDNVIIKIRAEGAVPSDRATLYYTEGGVSDSVSMELDRESLFLKIEYLTQRMSFLIDRVAGAHAERALAERNRSTAKRLIEKTEDQIRNTKDVDKQRLLYAEIDKLRTSTEGLTAQINQLSDELKRTVVKDQDAVKEEIEEQGRELERFLKARPDNVNLAEAMQKLSLAVDGLDRSNDVANLAAVHGHLLAAQTLLANHGAVRLIEGDRVSIRLAMPRDDCTWVLGGSDEVLTPEGEPEIQGGGQEPRTCVVRIQAAAPGSGRVELVYQKEDGTRVRSFALAAHIEPRTDMIFRAEVKAPTSSDALTFTARVGDGRMRSLPTAVLASLAPLVDRSFDSPKKLGDELGKVLDRDALKRYRNRILAAADQRYRLTDDSMSILAGPDTLVKFEPRPVADVAAWTILPLYCQTLKDGTPYQMAQPRGEVSGIPGSSVRIQASVLRPVQSAILHVFETEDPKADDHFQRRERRVQSIPMDLFFKDRTVKVYVGFLTTRFFQADGAAVEFTKLFSPDGKLKEQGLRDAGFTENAEVNFTVEVSSSDPTTGNLMQIRLVDGQSAPNPAIDGLHKGRITAIDAAKKTLTVERSEGPTIAEGKFPLLTKTTRYSVEVVDVDGFHNDPIPRFGVQEIAEPAPTVRLLREEFPGFKKIYEAMSQKKLVGRDESGLFEGMPIPVGGAIPVAYSFDSPYGVDRAVLWFRIRKKTLSGNESNNSNALGIALDDADGTLKIRQILQGSSAEKAELKVEDQVTHAEGMRVNDVESFLKIANQRNIGEELSIRVKRGSDPPFTVLLKVGRGADEKFRPLELTRYEDRGGKGRFDLDRGLFDGSSSRDQIRFFPIPSDDEFLRIGLLSGGGHFSLETAKLDDGRPPQEDDELEFYIEVYPAANRDPKAPKKLGRPTGRSESRTKRFADVKGLLTLMQASDQEQALIRGLAVRQGDVFNTPEEPSPEKEEKQKKDEP